MKALLSFQVYKMVEGTFAYTKFLIYGLFAIKGNYKGPPTKCPKKKRPHYIKIGYNMFQPGENN